MTNLWKLLETMHKQKFLNTWNSFNDMIQPFSLIIWDGMFSKLNYTSISLNLNHTEQKILVASVNWCYNMNHDMES